jgi:hypothetical protein
MRRWVIGLPAAATKQKNKHANHSTEKRKQMYS